MRRRLGHLVKKELLQLRRDRRLMFVLLFAPVFQLFVFGYAVTLDIKHIPLVVCDRDRQAESRRLIQSFAQSGHFDVRGAVDSPADLDGQLASGRALVGLYVPADFTKRLERGEVASIQVLLDGTDMNSAGVAGGYTAGLLAHHALSRGPVLRAGPQVDHRPRVWYNPDLKSVNYMVPGVICMIVGAIMTAVTAMAIVRERETGTLEQLIVTPVRRWELMLGKTLPFAAIGLLDVGVITLVARYWFGVPVSGSVLLLLALSTLALVTTLGLGLFVSTVSRSQQQAMLTAFFIIIPSVILSGFMYPIENMPRPVQALTYVIPLRYFVEIVRGIFLRGAGIRVLWPQVLALAGLGGAIFTLSAMRFQKRLG